MVDNDGYLVLSLRKSEVARRCFWMQLKINELIMNGMRLKDMPADLFVMPTEGALRNTLCANIGVFICNRATDQLDFTEAERIAWYLLEHATGLSGLNRLILTSEIVFGELIGLNRQEILDPLFTKEFKIYLKSMARYPAVIRLQYTHELLVKRDAAEADKWLATFEKIAKSYPYPCDIESEREILAVAKNIGLDRF
jgi:hypothetical protein